MIIIIYIYTVEKSVEWGQFLDIMNSEIDPLAVFLHTVYTQNKQNKTSPCLCELLQALLPLEALIADDPGGEAGDVSALARRRQRRSLLPPIREALHVGVQTTQLKPALETRVFMERFESVSSVEPGHFQPPSSLHCPTST